MSNFEYLKLDNKFQLKPGDIVMATPDAANNNRIEIKREEPVPPLPTAPYTVIRVMWTDRDGETLLVRAGEHWRDLGSGVRVDSLNPTAHFEVLSEPRAVTAKAVLNEVVHRLNGPAGYENSVHQILDDVAGEFGAPE